MMALYPFSAYPLYMLVNDLQAVFVREQGKK